MFASAVRVKHLFFQRNKAGQFYVLLVKTVVLYAFRLHHMNLPLLGQQELSVSSKRCVSRFVLKPVIGSIVSVRFYYKSPLDSNTCPVGVRVKHRRTDIIEYKTCSHSRRTAVLGVYNSV